MNLNLLNLIIILSAAYFVYAQQKNPYKILQLNEGATAQQIQQKFRELTKKYHPDKNKDPKAAEFYKEITNAYDTLSNPEAKRKYEDELERNERKRQNSYFAYGYDNYDQKQKQYRRKWHEMYQTKNRQSYQADFNKKKNEHQPRSSSYSFGWIGKIFSFSLKEVLVYGIAFYIIFMIFKSLITIQVGQN